MAPVRTAIAKKGSVSLSGCKYRAEIYLEANEVYRDCYKVVEEMSWVWNYWLVVKG